MYDVSSIYKAESVADAVRYLAANDDAIIINGGTDVLIKLREGEHEQAKLLSIHALPELVGIHIDAKNVITIRSATTFAQVVGSEIIKKHIPALGQACDQVGSPQIREMGTVGGNICNGAVSADSAPILLCLNATLVLESAAGTREVKLTDFYTGPGKTVRRHEELLTAVKIDPADFDGFGAHYFKFGQRKALEIATIGCAVHLKLGEDKRTIVDYRIAFGVAAPTPIRCAKTEGAVLNKKLEEDVLALIAESVLGEVKPRDSWRASKVFRLQLIRELSKRATVEAFINAGGKYA